MVNALLLVLIVFGIGLGSALSYQKATLDLPKAFGIFAGALLPGGAMLLAIFQAVITSPSVGESIAVILAIGSAAGYVGRKLTRIQTVLLTRGIEHEMLIYDYCERHSIEVTDLPTRAAQEQAKKQSAGSIF